MYAQTAFAVRVVKIKNYKLMKFLPSPYNYNYTNGLCSYICM